MEDDNDGRRLMMEDDLWWKTTYDGKRLMMEDDLWWKATTQNTKHKTQNTKRKTQNTKHKTQNTKHKTQNTKRKTQNTKHKTQNTAQDTRHQTRTQNTKTLFVTPSSFLLPPVHENIDDSGVANERVAKNIGKAVTQLSWFASALKTAREAQPPPEFVNLWEWRWGWRE